MNNKYFKLLLTERDLFPLVVAIVAFVLSLLGVSSIFDGKVDLNSKYPFFLYVTLGTLVATILDPIFEIFKIDSKKKKLFTISFGAIVAFITWAYNIYNCSLLIYIQSISRRGGFSAISLVLLLWNIVYINYQLQVLKENEITREKEKRIEALEEIKILKTRIAEMKGEKSDY